MIKKSKTKSKSSEFDVVATLVMAFDDETKVKVLKHQHLRLNQHR